MSRQWVYEAGVVTALLVLAAWLRLVHLGTPSLWWDELVHIQTADRPLAAVVREVKWGIPPGAGNAGAMPVDYVLLHTYLRAVDPPTPERLEVYYRAPSCVYSLLAVLALYLVARTLFGRAVATLATLLLATSLPAILYAAEARSYSLLTLVTILDLAAFARVLRHPRRPLAWIVYAALNVVYFLTGLFGLFVIAWQYLLLVVLLVLRREARPATGMLVATSLALGFVVITYFTGIAVGTKHTRDAVVEPLAVTWNALGFFAGNVPALRIAFLAALPFAVWAGRVRRRGLVALALVLSFGSLPFIALLIKWKHYYFHPRHVLFLLPLFHVALALGALHVLRVVDPLRRLVDSPRTRRALETALVCALVLAAVLPTLRAFVIAPHWQFARTKTLRDTKGLVQRLRATTAGDRYLLVAERDSTANAMLSAYLRWYRLDDRVALRSPGIPIDQVETVLRTDGGDPRRLGLRAAVGLTPDFRRLLDLERPIGDVPSRVTRFGLVAYSTPLVGRDVRRFFNLTLREPAAIAPSPPRS